MSGDAKFSASQDVLDFPYARYAETLGLLGLLIERPDHVGPVWDMALSADRPCVIDAHVDPEVPPLPPHITLEQAKAFMGSILAGDPEAGHYVHQSIRQGLASFLPQKK